MKSFPDEPNSANFRVWQPEELKQPDRVEKAPQVNPPPDKGSFEPFIFSLPTANSLFEKAFETPALPKGKQNPSPKELVWAVAEYGPESLEDHSVLDWAPQELKVYQPARIAKQTGEVPDGYREAILQEERIKILYEAQKQADELIAQAQYEAGEYIQKAQLSANEVFECAREEGLSSAQGQTENLVKMIGQLVEETRDWQERVFQASQVQVLGLIQNIAVKLFGVGFALNEQQLSRVFERGLNEAKSLGDLRVKVHPEDLATLNELWPMHQMALRGQKIELLPDQDIQRGGCYIEGQYGTVDSRVSTQLRIIQQQFMEEMEKTAHHEEPFAVIQEEMQP